MVALKIIAINLNRKHHKGWFFLWHNFSPKHIIPCGINPWHILTSASLGGWQMLWERIGLLFSWLSFPCGKSITFPLLLLPFTHFPEYLKWSRSVGWEWKQIQPSLLKIYYLPTGGMLIDSTYSFLFWAMEIFLWNGLHWDIILCPRHNTFSYFWELTWKVYMLIGIINPFPNVMFSRVKVLFSSHICPEL